MSLSRVLTFGFLLIVNSCAERDPVPRAAGISGEPNTVITGELGRPLQIRCLAYGYPQPLIYWYRGLTGPMVPYSSSLYEARDNILKIRELNLETLGEYACQAYNGIEKPASWPVVVQAYQPDDSWPSNPYLIPREVVVTPRVAHTETTAPSPPTPEVPEYEYTYRVPVKATLRVEQPALRAGSQLNAVCEVDGYPEPDVYWTKDSMRINQDDRTQIFASRLMISNVHPEDSGLYECHAANQYSSSSSSVQVTVQQGVYIPPQCTDNPFFADCHLIVQGKFCLHRYYSKFCCKSCVEAGQLDPSQMDMQADMQDDSWPRTK